MATKSWVNIGSGNGLLPDSTKSLPEPMLTNHQWSPVTFISRQFHKRCLSHHSLKSIWKLHIKKFNSNFPGANELNTIKLAPAPTPRVAHWEPTCVIPSNAFSHKWYTSYSGFVVQTDPCAVRTTFCQPHTEIMVQSNKCIALSWQGTQVTI